jgi:trehalose 6-phosphate synthase/phosphatase
MLKALAKLAVDDNTFVYVVSGRDQKTLDNWLGGIKNLGMR